MNTQHIPMISLKECYLEGFKNAIDIAKILVDDKWKDYLDNTMKRKIDIVNSINS